MTESAGTKNAGTEESPRFAFGKNWESFIAQNFDESRLKIASDHLLGFLKTDTLEGKRFLDIGSGSGLHSLAACRAGAREIVSFDYDRHSVSTTAGLRHMAGDPPHWRVEQGSVLDAAYMESLGTFDIVYSWGVLHHTGDQWTAIRNAAARVRPGGLFYVALYTSDVFTPPRDAEFWLRIKRRYNEGGALTRRYLEMWYAAGILYSQYRQGNNPISYATGYKKSRGMSFYHDVRDWVGGWPMEFSWIAEVKQFLGDEQGGGELGFELVNIATGHANTEYLYRRPDGAA